MEIVPYETVPLRDVWKGEAKDFNQWLSNNLDYLKDKLGTRLSLIQTGKKVGPYFADIHAQDEYGNIWVIECQLEKTNHDHLGKLLTYVMGLNAAKALWICKEASDEHRRTVDWLNTITQDSYSFYLLKVEAIKISSTKTAPRFEVLCKPTLEGKAAGKNKSEEIVKYTEYHDFWEQLLQKCKSKTNLFANNSAPKGDYLGSWSGGFSLNLLIRSNTAIVELWVDQGNYKINQYIYEELYTHKDGIEKAIGKKLIWNAPQIGKRSMTLRVEAIDHGIKDKAKWDEIQNALIDTVIIFEQTMRPHIEKLKKQSSIPF